MQEVDDEARIGEALTKTIICALKSKPSADNEDNWLNPTEVTPNPPKTTSMHRVQCVQHVMYGKMHKLSTDNHATLRTMYSPIKMEWVANAHEN